MQNVLIEKPYEFVPPYKSVWLQRLIIKLGVHKRVLRKNEGVVKHECRNLDLLRASLQAGHGVMLTPNHPRTADPAVMSHVANETPCPFYAMASWHLFNQDWQTTFMVRAMGAFSVNREGLDKRAIDFAINALQTAERPLLIFPEGTTSRTNDRLMSLMEGPAFIARTAAKRRAKKDGGKVVVHPVGIRYLFEGDVEKACCSVLSDLENKLTWKPQTELSLFDRLVKVGNGLLTLKEQQYDCPVPPDTPLRDRQTNLVNHLLHPLEVEWLGSQQDGGIAIRIKNLRMKIFPEMSRSNLEPAERKRRWKQLERTYLAQQVDCYPDNYVAEHPSVDRYLETCEKFDEDINDAARLHGHLKVIVDICPAIEVSTKRERGATTDPLMVKIRESLESKLAELQNECQMYEGPA
jgi:1-acyl-sn-glycerol-3-phosphate acyltransferase